MRIPESLLLLCTFIACGVTAAPAERRVQLEFSGTTFASHSLIEDVIRNVTELGNEQLDCEMPDAVVAEALPDDFTPVNAARVPEGARGPVYERWTVSFCGNEVPVLLTFWTLEQGGTAFDVDFDARQLAAAEDINDAGFRPGFRRGDVSRRNDGVLAQAVVAGK